MLFRSPFSLITLKLLRLSFWELTIDFFFVCECEIFYVWWFSLLQQMKLRDFSSRLTLGTLNFLVVFLFLHVWILHLPNNFFLIFFRLFPDEVWSALLSSAHDAHRFISKDWNPFRALILLVLTFTTNPNLFSKINYFGFGLLYLV